MSVFQLVPFFCFFYRYLTDFVQSLRHRLRESRRHMLYDYDRCIQAFRKVWNDADDYDHVRPASVTVQLRASVLYNGVTTEIPSGKIPYETVVTLSEDNDWQYTWHDLPEVIPEDDPEVEIYKNLEITYWIDEVNVPAGYTSTVTGNMFEGYTVTNTHEPQTTSFRVLKVWDDAGHEEARPEKIVVRLHDGHQGRTLELNAANGWSGSFENLPVFRNGERIAYSLTEDHVPNYVDTVVFDGVAKIFTVTNTYHPRFREVSVVKDWFDTGHEAFRPASITVELYADGVPTGMTLELTAAGRWVGLFPDLPETKAGQPIVYTVVEKNVPRGYTATVSGNADTGFVIKNTHYSNMPKTGDTALPIPLLAAVNALSLLGFAALLPVCFAKRRRKHGA